MKKKIAVIGSGFSGLSATAYLAKAEYEVHVFEKHEQPGGRARQFSTQQGYVFDMGPSWYWMPDIIESFFADFGYKISDFFELISLNPQFEMIFSQKKISVPESLEELKILFEQIEKGAGLQLEKFMRSAKFKYEVGMQDFVTKPCHNWSEFISPKIAKSALRLDLLTNFRTYVAKYFKSEKLRTLMEFPVIFLGASPKNIYHHFSNFNLPAFHCSGRLDWQSIAGIYDIIVRFLSSKWCADRHRIRNTNSKLQFRRFPRYTNTNDTNRRCGLRIHTVSFSALLF